MDLFFFQSRRRTYAGLEGARWGRTAHSVDNKRRHGSDRVARRVCVLYEDHAFRRDTEGTRQRRRRNIGHERHRPRLLVQLGAGPGRYLLHRWKYWGKQAALVLRIRNEKTLSAASLSKARIKSRDLARWKNANLRSNGPVRPNHHARKLFQVVPSETPSQADPIRRKRTGKKLSACFGRNDGGRERGGRDTGM